VPLTLDHKPSDPTEAARIIAAGGTVTRNRVNGQLAVSRSFGDFSYKTPPAAPPSEQMVSAAPSTVAVPRSVEADEFLILACAGCWTAVTNQDACHFIAELLSQGAQIEVICQKFLDYCIIANSRENLTIVLTVFPAARKLQPKAYLSAPGYKSATASQPNLGSLNSHAGRAGASAGLQAQNRRASITLFDDLKADDGRIKISTAAATNADTVAALNKSVVGAWTETEVAENFLRNLELESHAAAFAEEGVDGKLFLELTQLEMEDDLMMNPLDARFLKMATTFLTQR